MIDDVDSMTERLLSDAGIEEGMRVLDFGCGRGDVACRAAARVGASGMVLGVDRDEFALSTARDRARSLKWSTVTFTREEPASIAGAYPPFDAIVGRRVLMYLADPAETLAELATALRPGGVMGFQEHDATLTASVPDALPLFHRARAWIWDTVTAEGGNRHMGFDLYRTFERAGLVVQSLHAEAVIHNPRSRLPFEGIVRAMLPRIVSQGVATASEIDVDTLDQRLLEERVAANATSISELVFRVVAKKTA